jgi:flagellin
MLSLHTNSAALSAQNSIGRTQSSLSTSQTRLSTGFRVNSAMDDAAGLQIATRLKAQTSGMAMAMRNTQNSISMLQTAEGAFDEVTTMLTRMKDLATQAADASSTAKDQAALQSEYDALGTELNNVMKNTTFGGATLLDGGSIASAMTFQIGASKSETMSMNLSASMTTLVTTLGTVTARYAAPTTTTASVEISDGSDGTAVGATNAAGQTAANATIDTISTAIDQVGSVRSSLGATANRLDHVYNNLSNISTNTQAASGRIMDTDFATESSNMTSSQMLLQAGTAMLKQSNSTSSLVMSLLQ